MNEYACSAPFNVFALKKVKQTFCLLFQTKKENTFDRNKRSTSWKEEKKWNKMEKISISTSRYYGKWIHSKVYSSTASLNAIISKRIYKVWVWCATKNRWTNKCRRISVVFLQISKHTRTHTHTLTHTYTNMLNRLNV